MPNVYERISNLIIAKFKVMKVAIIFIGTNRYLDFLPRYYEHIEKHFLPKSEKVFLVFTDGEMEDLPDNIKVYNQKHLEWPYFISQLLFGDLGVCSNSLKIFI